MPLLHHLLVPLLVAMFLALNMGGSSTAPAFSSAYRSNVIRKSLIPGLFGLMVLIGAIVAGSRTAGTLGKGIISPDLLNYVQVTIILLSTAISILISNIIGIPQSTVQSTVMAVVAPAYYFNHLDTHNLFGKIIPMWFFLPVMAYILCLLAGRYIYNPIRKKGYTMRKEVNENPIIRIAIIVMSLYVAFAVGANNVANAAGPITTMIMKELNMRNENDFNIVLILCTLIIAPSFGIGSSIFGPKIVHKTSNEILLFGRVEAVIISFISASLLLISSVKGIPSSLVQLNVAAILGMGVAKYGSKNIFKKTEVQRFFFMWIFAPLMAFTLSYTFTYLANQWGMFPK